MSIPLIGITTSTCPHNDTPQWRAPGARTRPPLTQRTAASLQFRSAWRTPRAGGGGLGGGKWADHPPFGLDRVRPDAAGRHELVGDGVVRCRTIIAATEELPVPTGSGCVGRGRAAANLPDRALVRLRRAHLWHHPTAVSRCCISTMATRKTPRGGGGEVGTGWASCRRSHSVRAPVVLPVSTCWPPVAGRTASAVSADARCTTGKGAL